MTKGIQTLSEQLRPLPNPYVGPRSFKLGETLFGRDKEAVDLLDLLIARRIILLYSPSGAGKTSLIQAGLIPSLEREGFLIRPILRVSLDASRLPEFSSVTQIPRYNRFTFSVLYSLEAQVPEWERLPVVELAGLTLTEYLSSKSTSPAEVFDEVLIFDQFEEILTIATAEQQVRRTFFQQLGAALQERNRWALFAIREDYLASLDPYLLYIPTRFANTFRLNLLSVNAARQAIQAPARLQEVDFTAPAADKLLDDLRKMQVSLPDGSTQVKLGPYIEPMQLQVVCYSLWEKLDSRDSVITEDKVDTIGNVDASLEAYYASKMQMIGRDVVDYTDGYMGKAARPAGTAERQERLIREWFERQLITSGGQRNRVLMEREKSGGLDNSIILKLLDTHLVRGEENGGMTWYELAHDRLVAPVRQNNADWFEAHLAPVQRQVALWEKQSRPEGLLMRGKDLLDAEIWASTHTHEMLPVEMEFLNACRTLAERERRSHFLNRLIRFMIVLALLLGVIATLFGINAQRAKMDALNAKATAQANLNKALDRLMLAQTQLIDARESKNEILKFALAIESFNKLNDAESYLTLWSQISQIRPDNLYLKTIGGSIKTVCFSPDGKLLVSGNEDLIQVWDAQTGVQLIKIALDSPLVKLVCSHDGQKILSANQSGKILISDIRTGEPIIEIHHDGLTDFDYNELNHSIVSTGADNRIRLWNADTGDINQIFIPESSITNVIFSPDGEQIASADVDGNVFVWDLFNNQTHLLQTGTSDILLVYSPNSKWIVTGGKDGSIIFWDRKTGSKYKAIYHKRSIKVLDFSPDSHLLLSAAEDDQVKIWSTDSFVDIATVPTYGGAYSGGVSPNNRYFVIGGYSGYTSVFELGKPDPSGHASTFGLVFNADGSQVNQVMFSPDGKRVASACEDGTIILSTITTNSLYQEDQVWDIEFNRKNDLLVTASRDGTAKIWDIKTGSNILTLTHSNWVNHATFSPDGNFIATASSDHTAKVWKISDGKELFTIPHQDVVWTVKFSADGAYVASGGWDGDVQIWSVKNAAKTFEIQHAARINDIAFSPDNQWIITASDDHLVKVWGLHSQVEVLRLSHPSAVTAIGITPLTNTIISGDESGNVTIWNSLGQQIRSVSMEQSKIQSIAISPDGNLFAAGNEKGDVCVWQITDGKEQLCFSTERAIWDLAFSSSDYIFAASTDAYVHIWSLATKSEYGRLPNSGPALSIDLSSNSHILAMSTTAGISQFVIWKKEDLISEACKRLPRQLTRSEWKKFVGDVQYSPFCMKHLSEK